MTKVNTRENTRGSWLTEIEINEIRNTILTEVEAERNHQPDQLIPENENDNILENEIDQHQDERINDDLLIGNRMNKTNLQASKRD